VTKTQSSRSTALDCCNSFGCGGVGPAKQTNLARITEILSVLMGKVFYLRIPKASIALFVWCGEGQIMYDLAPLITTAVPRSVLRLSSCGITLVEPVLFWNTHCNAMALLPRWKMPCRYEKSKPRTSVHRCIGAVLQ
jgi:hypothetical protein